MFFDGNQGATRHLLAKGIAFFLLFLLFTSKILAQKQDTLREVVIQATKAPALGPSAFTVMSAAKIAANQQAADIPQLLSRMVGTVEQSDAGTGIGYAGLRIRGSDPTRINVTIDGIPFNDAESQGVYWVDLPDIAESATSIQVQRGVGWSTNGAGAFGGTINLDLSNIKATPGAGLTTTFGSFNTFKTSANAHSGLLKKHFSVSGRGSLVKSDGFIDRATADLKSIHLTGAYTDERQTFFVHWLGGHERTYQAWNGVPLQYLSDPELRRFNTAGTEKPGDPYENEVDDYAQNHLLALYRRNLSAHWALQLNGHYTRGKGYYEQYKAEQNLADYGLPTIAVGDSLHAASDLVRRLWLDNHFYGTTFALNFKQPGQEITLGGAANQYKGAHYGQVVKTILDQKTWEDWQFYADDALKNDANLYIKWTSSFGKGWHLFMDGQIRHVGYEFSGFNVQLEPKDQRVSQLFFNPKAGLSRDFGKKWQAWAYFGIANREANRDDYTQSTPDSRPKSERLWDYELGMRHRAEQWAASLNGYYMRYRDQLALTGVINEVGAYIRGNLPDSYRLGLEAEFETGFGNGWEVIANAALSENRVLQYSNNVEDWDGNCCITTEFRNTDLAFSPAVVSFGQVGYDFWKRKENQNRQLKISITGKYVGSQYLDNTGYAVSKIDGYFVSDVQLNWAFSWAKKGRVSLILAVKNALDRQYVSNGWIYHYKSSNDDRPNNPYTGFNDAAKFYYQAGYFPQAGRQLYGTVRWEF